MIQRVRDRKRANQVGGLRKVSRITPYDLAYLVARYLELAAHDRAEEGGDERFVILIGEGVEPDETFYAYLEPCLFFELSAGCSYRRFSLFDSSARWTN